MKRCKEYRQIGWNAISNDWGKSILFFILSMIVISGIGGTFFGIIIVGPFYVGMYLFYLRAVRREELSYGTLFEPITKGDFVRTMILYLLKMIFVALWSLLFFIPGIIKAYSYSMAEYIAIDNPNMSASDCITASRQLMDGKKAKLFLLDLSFIGWILLTMLSFGILIILVGPYQQATRAAFYEDIRPKTQQN
jgi:uncharacterized membrane protein